MLIPSCKIGLSGNTGSGKTYFCSHNLKQIAEAKGMTLHYICNRSMLKQQEQEADHFNHYHCYQSMMVEDFLDSPKRVYIVDECHFFHDDSAFNYEIDDKLQYLLSMEQSVVIFMSATANNFWNHCKKINVLDFYFEIKFEYDYVDRVCTYHSQTLRNEEIKYLLDNTNDKIVLFCSSVTNGWKMYRKLSEIYGEDDVKFRCSNSVSNGSSSLEKQELVAEARQYVINHYYNESENGFLTLKNTDFLIKSDGSLNCRLLITTKALDNGVNIKDPLAKHVFSEIIDIQSLKQSLGRIRNVGQRVNFYIYCRSRKDIEARFLNPLHNKLAFFKDIIKYDNLDELVYSLQVEDYSVFEKLGMTEEQIEIMIKSFAKNKKVSMLSYTNTLINIVNLQYAVKHSYYHLIKYQMFKEGEISEDKWCKLQDEQSIRESHLKDKEKEECLNSLLNRELTRSELKAIAKQFQLWNDKRHLYNLEQVINWLLEQGYQVKIIEPKYKNHGKKYIIEKLGNKRF